MPVHFIQSSNSVWQNVLISICSHLCFRHFRRNSRLIGSTNWFSFHFFVGFFAFVWKHCNQTSHFPYIGQQYIRAFFAMLFAVFFSLFSVCFLFSFFFHCSMKFHTPWLNERRWMGVDLLKKWKLFRIIWNAEWSRVIASYFHLNEIKINIYLLQMRALDRGECEGAHGRVYVICVGIILGVRY